MPSTLLWLCSLFGILATVQTHAPTFPGPCIPKTSATFIGSVEFPSGTKVDGVTLGGLSALTFDADRNVWYALSDHRGVGIPSKFFTFSVNVSDGSLDEGDIVFSSSTTLKNPDGTDIDRSLDTEGITQDSEGFLWISSEQNEDGRVPEIFQIFVNGTATGKEIPIPERYIGVNHTVGVRKNLGHEALANSFLIDWDTGADAGAKVWVAGVEGALTQDGEEANLINGSLARVFFKSAPADSHTDPPEFVYLTDPIPVAPISPDKFADLGLVEVLPIERSARRFLTLERSFATGAPDRGFTVSLYEACVVDGVTDVAAVFSLKDIPSEDLTVLQKDLVFNVGEETGEVVDNLEGMAFGPTLSDGRRLLMMMSDDNFSYFGPQTTQFLAFAVNFAPFAKDDFFETEADSLLVGDLTRNDEDREWDAFSVSAFRIIRQGTVVEFEANRSATLDSGALLTVFSNGTFVFDPRGGAYEGISANGTWLEVFGYWVEEDEVVEGRSEPGMDFARVQIQLGGRGEKGEGEEEAREEQREEEGEEEQGEEEGDEVREEVQVHALAGEGVQEEGSSLTQLWNVTGKNLIFDDLGDGR
uniref:Phytase-like domain-containing protein n=1 Tax=Chromera velia CCMP2878 TaxID=1169474 RepID=A0A0G4ICP7_9ALVE|eukprot:Cvel_13087.t1-p1 / transcript=Cvel_13087.t1 / gene=Cvel_13087 / organism=Chromera_velia_CCMP2878 / gene_product=hypothetical protein / transcript_product=hypothetical protein / location=Cvel_scaffold881:43066-46955(-) / protein_length=586 / sequence_SO=supercontig / SO=protein_coding / is_pseudo=false